MHKLFPYAKAYRIHSIICPFLMIAEVIFELFIPYYMADIIDVGIAEANMPYILRTGAKMLTFALCALICGASAARLSSIAAMGLGANVREAMFGRMQEFSFANIDKFSTASLVTRMTTDVTTVQNVYQMLLRMTFRAPVQFVSALILCFRINRKVSVVFLFVIPLIVCFMLIFGPLAMKRFKKMMGMFDGLNASLQENLIGIRVVKAFAREPFEKQKFEKANSNLVNAAISAERLMVTAQPLMMLVLYATILVIVYLSSRLIVAGELEIGKFTTVVTYIMQILMSLVMIAMLLVNYVLARASISRICEVLNEEPQIKDKENADTAPIPTGSVEFKDVSFKYNPEGAENVVDHVSFSVKSGETIGIVGGTGSAKTTLLSLIPRLYDVTEGEVLVSGKNVKDYSIETLREACSMVLQKNVLFSGSILENLRWGNENATKEEIIEACKAAQAHDFIESFPDGYETDLGQGGVNVSGGQKQRLCIARALLKKPRILILDDSTSAVDTITDSKIRAAFRKEIPDTTVFIIAQRITSVMDADKIIVLNSGKIEDMGTHEELLERCPVYEEIYLSQQKGTLQQEGGLSDGKTE